MNGPVITVSCAGYVVLVRVDDAISMLVVGPTHVLSSAAVKAGKIKTPNNIVVDLDQWTSPVRLTLFFEYDTATPHGTAIGWVSAHTSLNDRISEAERVASWFSAFELR